MVNGSKGPVGPQEFVVSSGHRTAGAEDVGMMLLVEMA